MLRKQFFYLLLFVCSISWGQNIPNPIIPRLADAGVLKYNGKYYLGGVFTDGDFYVSNDLVHWSEPVHVLSMDNDWTKGSSAGNDQIHANDMVYLNGTFHFYWSVNYWGKDKHAVHISHAQSKDVLGPYVEPEKSKWMDNRIDPMLFKDDDGQLYMYMVRFTDGNAIWVRKMKNPMVFDSHPISLISALPNTWESLDNKVVEGPWVIKYRDQYYMIYNANDTSPRWGNYKLGVAVSNDPLGFQHGNKYNHPIVESNQVQLEENYVDILRYNKNQYCPLFSYTMNEPSKGWQMLNFNTIDWKEGSSGFSSVEISGSATRYLRTFWDTDNLWLRKKISLNKIPESLALRTMHDGDTKIYLNGSLIYEQKGADSRVINLNAKQKKYLKPGENVLSVETHKGKANFFDVSLFDMKGDTADDVLMTPGQPNVLKGPNGFEWWLIYMANKNNEPRSQYISRVHFFNQTMVVDPITSTNTVGYYPSPSLPTYGDVFDRDVNIKDKWSWNNSQSWSVKNGELIKKQGDSSYGLLKNSLAASAYLFEVGINTKDEAGVIAWWKDEQNCAYLGFEESSNCWYFKTLVNGKETKESFILPSDFQWGVYHTLRMERNTNLVRVFLDGIPAPGKSLFSFTSLPFERTIPGLFGSTGETYFDGLTYTLGFDDFGIDMSSWDIIQGEYENTKEGLLAKSIETIALKGNELKNYEYSVQVSNLTNQGEAGSYPIYVDERNYVKAVFNAETQKMDVTIVKKGKIILQKKYALDNLKTVYPDVKYTDFIEKTYLFPESVWLNEIHLNKHHLEDKTRFADNMFNKLTIDYLKDETWVSLETNKEQVASHPAYNYISFSPLKIDGLRFINKEPEDLQRHIYKIRINEQFKEAYNFRAVRKGDLLYLFVDGREVDQLNVDFPASCIGLGSSGASPIYNGILYYHIGDE